MVIIEKKLKKFFNYSKWGFKDIYSDDNRINNYLTLLEKEIVEIQKYLYLKDKRYFEKDFNFKGKNLSRIILDIENQILQIMINYFVSKNVNIFTIEYDGLKIYSDDKRNILVLTNYKDLF